MIDSSARLSQDYCASSYGLTGGKSMMDAWTLFAYVCMHVSFTGVFDGLAWLDWMIAGWAAVLFFCVRTTAEHGGEERMYEVVGGPYRRAVVRPLVSVPIIFWLPPPCHHDSADAWRPPGIVLLFVATILWVTVACYCSR